MEPRVVIIGAGISGIAAAKTLIDSGIGNVTILEAANRVGGRIWSKEVEQGDESVLSFRNREA